MATPPLPCCKVRCTPSIGGLCPCGVGEVTSVSCRCYQTVPGQSCSNASILWCILTRCHMPRCILPRSPPVLDASGGLVEVPCQLRRPGVPSGAAPMVLRKRSCSAAVIALDATAAPPTPAEGCAPARTASHALAHAPPLARQQGGTAAAAGTGKPRRERASQAMRICSRVAACASWGVAPSDVGTCGRTHVLRAAACALLTHQAQSFRAIACKEGLHAAIGARASSCQTRLKPRRGESSNAAGGCHSYVHDTCTAASCGLVECGWQEPWNACGHRPGLRLPSWSLRQPP